MTKSRPYAATAILASALLLSACGGGSGPGGGGSDFPEISPVQGMSFETAERLGLTEGEQKAFDFVNESDQHNGGYVQLFSGESDGEQSRDPAATLVWEQDGQPQDHQQPVSYREGYYADQGFNSQRISVEEKNMDGRNGNTDNIIYARDYNNSNDETNSFIYVPADSQSQAHVGMAGRAGTAQTARIGIFGTRTTSAQLQQSGSATYQGFSHGYADDGDPGVNGGEYTGRTTATVRFNTREVDMAANLSRTGGGQDPADSLTYQVSGTLDGNGGINGTSAQLNGAAATNHSVQGALFGPNSDSMGYTYTLTGPDTDGFSGGSTITGGAILNRD